MAKLPDWAVGPHNDIEPGVEVRPNEDGTIDEICFTVNGVNFHLEQMDTGCYWIGVSWQDGEGEERMQHITLSTCRKAAIYPSVGT